MALLNRKPRPLAREERTFRDDRLFIVATEDTYAPRQYFEFLRQSRLQVIVLPTPKEGGRSAPRHVLERLRDYARQFELAADDQLWLLLDVDHWTEGSHLPGLVETLNDARRQGIRIAMSNPCFDLWLLLHHEEVTASHSLPHGPAVGARIREVAGGFNKCHLHPEHYRASQIRQAIQRARKLEAFPDNPKGYWPEKPGTRVYRLVEELLGNREMIPAQETSP